MSTDIDVLRLRQTLGRDVYGPPVPWGVNGWLLRGTKDGTRGSVVVSATPGLDPEHPATEWVHASISWDDRDPTYAELADLHKAVWRDGYAVQVFVPPRFHVNFHEHALHLWGRLDGKPIVPEFSLGGMI